MPPLTLSYKDPSALKPAPNNPRKHSDKQVAELAKAIEAFGFNNPVLVDEGDTLVAGHGRVLAARRLGIRSIPTVCLSHLTAAQKRAYIIADNRLAELAEWDPDALRTEFAFLLESSLDFDVTDIGFSMPEIDALVIGDAPAASDPADDVAPIDQVPVFARPGDLWQLGDHLVFCGDALDPASYRILMGSDLAQMVITDPPYNVPIAGHVSGKGRARHRDFAMASGEMSRSEFSNFLHDALRNAADVSQEGACHFVFMDWRHLDELMSAGRSIYSQLINLCVWVKSNGGMGSLYRSQHELVLVYRYGRTQHINNVALGRHGRNRTNVWSHAGMSSFQPKRAETLGLHPTIKPTALITDAILDCSERGGLVLDPFGGSGTTVLAADRSGRRARVIELDPRYVDVSIYRFVKETGKPATNLWTDRRIAPADVQAISQTPTPTQHQRSN